ncbi:hypothetical protein F511_12661 [Dorcoceras hygrometricum]|uniref:Uncharacterized protein n=1 Tax=Dorcoceras hygrometricum TaxID=472368 RepID=A0A2Z7CEF3_9LAMI|nr:hypothetical protein F511_12661 [Dorcoceras hygrometricum]
MRTGVARTPRACGRQSPRSTVHDNRARWPATGRIARRPARDAARSYSAHDSARCAQLQRLAPTSFTGKLALQRLPVGFSESGPRLESRLLLVGTIPTARRAAARGATAGGAWDVRPRGEEEMRGGGLFPCGNREASTCVTLNGSGIQLVVGPQLRLRNHNFGLIHWTMVKRLATSPHDPLGITDSACKNQSVMCLRRCRLDVELEVGGSFRNPKDRMRISVWGRDVRPVFSQSAVGRCAWRSHRICLSVRISSWKDISSSSRNQPLSDHVSCWYFSRFILVGSSSNASLDFSRWCISSYPAVARDQLLRVISCWYFSCEDQQRALRDSEATTFCEQEPAVGFVSYQISRDPICDNCCTEYRGCEGERQYRTLISLLDLLALMRQVVNYHSSWVGQRQVELFDASGIRVWCKDERPLAVVPFFMHSICILSYAVL